MQHARLQRANARYAHHDREANSVNNLMFREMQSTVYRNGKNHKYKQGISTCEKCGKKFYQSRDAANYWIEKGKKPICNPCLGNDYPAHYIGTDTEQKIQRFHEGTGCTVRKMTPEERNKYLT